MGDLVGSKTRLSAASIELKLLYLVALCIFNPLLKSQDDPRIFSGYRGREGGGGVSSLTVELLFVAGVESRSWNAPSCGRVSPSPSRVWWPT